MADEMKVYELAKELGSDSLALLDTIRNLGIVVKNHMSELRREDIETVRHFFKKGSESKTHAKTVSKARKKVTAEAAPVDEKKASHASPIIRRRGKVEPEAPLVEHVEIHEEELIPEEAIIHKEAPQEIEAAVIEAPIIETLPPEEPPVEQPAPPVVRQRPPVFLTPRPVAPRRSILKIVEPTAPPPRPIIRPAPVITPAKASMRGTATQDKEGFRIIKMTKENLDEMAQEEAAKKRGGGREAELRPEDVRFADYRKKELVFLPKKKKIPLGKEIKKTQKTVAKAQKRVVFIRDGITVGDLAAGMSLKASDVLRKLINMGQMVNIHHMLDYDTATLIAQEYQYEVRNVAFDEIQVLSTDTQKELQPRPPVVTIMGHVDHGKTTLLDSIRHAHVAEGEAGGITQHIGAYSVQHAGKTITFIDTPGHAAFSMMRARGAGVTDIVIIVVAADDGVMPQTREAIIHAQAAQVPIIVAVNKMDKPGATMEKVKQTLSELNLLAEDWGGDTQFIGVSALKKMGLDQLLEAITIQAEMLDLRADATCRAHGAILEASIERGRGPVMTVLVTRGTLRTGDAIVAGSFAGKVRALRNDQHQPVDAVGPGMPVEVLGLDGVPASGETFDVPDSETDARNIAQNRQDKTRAKIAGAQQKVSLEELYSKIQAGNVKELAIVLKGDAFGSVEAIRDSLLKLSTDKVRVKVLLAAAGTITESDILLASASKALILGFQVKPETKARQVADAEHIEIRTYSIIYELLDDVKKCMTGLLDKKKIERFCGRAEVRQVFSVPKIGVIGGAFVVDGKIPRGACVRLLRSNKMVFEGKMSSLKRFKDDTKEVASGFECGIGIENYTDLKMGDIIEAFQIDFVAPELGE